MMGDFGLYLSMRENGECDLPMDKDGCVVVLAPCDIFH